MTHDELVERAVKWLKSTGRCGVAVPELVTYCDESPDAIGWRSEGQICVLIECKASRSDFLSDKKKFFRKHPEEGVGNKRYFMTPPGLIDPKELPENWGLLEVNSKQVRKVRESGDHCIGWENYKSMRMMYSLLRRTAKRGDLVKCLAKKWGGDFDSEITAPEKDLPRHKSIDHMAGSMTADILRARDEKGQ